MELETLIQELKSSLRPFQSVFNFDCTLTGSKIMIHQSCQVWVAMLQQLYMWSHNIKIFPLRRKKFLGTLNTLLCTTKNVIILCLSLIRKILFRDCIIILLCDHMYNYNTTNLNQRVQSSGKILKNIHNSPLYLLNSFYTKN